MKKTQIPLSKRAKAFSTIRKVNFWITIALFVFIIMAYGYYLFFIEVRLPINIISFLFVMMFTLMIRNTMRNNKRIDRTNADDYEKSLKLKEMLDASITYTPNPRPNEILVILQLLFEELPKNSHVYESLQQFLKEKN